MLSREFTHVRQILTVGHFYENVVFLERNPLNVFLMCKCLVEEIQKQ